MTEPIPDPRVAATQLAADAISPMGRQLKTGMWVVLSESAALADGRLVAFHSPEPATFFLLTAKTLRDLGEKERTAALAETRVLLSGELEVSDPGRLLDGIGHLSAAVLLAFGAIEALANTAVDEVPPETSLTFERGDELVEVEQGEMVRRLSVAEKLDRVLPLVTGRPSIKGTVAWQRFVELRRLRDALVHVKQRGYSADTTSPEAFGRLVRGDGTTCVEYARAVIEAARPGWLSGRALDALDA